VARYAGARRFRCFPNSLRYGGEIVAGRRAHWLGERLPSGNRLLAIYLEAHAWNVVPDGRWSDTAPYSDSQIQSGLLFLDAARRVETGLCGLLARYLELLNPDLRVPKCATIREWAAACRCRTSRDGGFTVSPSPGRKLSPAEVAEVEKIAAEPCLGPDILICFAPREKIMALWPATSLAREIYVSRLPGAPAGY
jgi:hypothetical protein